MTAPAPDLAAYAIRPEHGRGRAHPEPDDPVRSDYVLDRHRVVHCTAFRRLEYKTQVFVIHEGDHFRTRLTHSLEVAHHAIELARALRVNERLAEVVALAHDLGHTPFGHAGEAALAERMKACGGFEHNRQSLRIVEYLEHPYPAFRGLNLMAETLECLASHNTQYDNPDVVAQQGLPPIEGQINDVADRLAYDGHDIEDALGAGLIVEDDLSGLGLWMRAAEPIRREHPTAPLPAIRRPIIDALIREVLVDVIERTRKRLTETNPQSPDDVRSAKTIVVAPSEAVDADLRELERFLFEHVYRHPRIVEMDSRAKRRIEETFDAFVADPSRLPPRFRRRIDEQGLEWVICDYVAGMTDRFLEAEHERLCG